MWKQLGVIYASLMATVRKTNNTAVDTKTGLGTSSSLFIAYHNVVVCLLPPKHFIGTFTC